MQKPTADQREGEEVFSTEDLCSFAKISYDTFQRYRKEGNGPPEVVFKKSIRFLKSDVIKWLADLRGQYKASDSTSQGE
jgi:predicted DNA-binding transcriptional regulator AlpA